MSGSFLSRRVDQPVRFRSGDSALEGKLESVRLFLPDGGEPELVLTVWFEYGAFRRIDQQHVFGYTFESLDLADGQLFELVSSLPVQLELRAEGPALAALAGLSGDALLDGAVTALTGDDASSPLFDVAGYRYLALYQE